MEAAVRDAPDTVVVVGGSTRLRRRVVHGFVGKQDENCVEWRIDTKYYTAGAGLCECKSKNGEILLLL